MYACHHHGSSSADPNEASTHINQHRRYRYRHSRSYFNQPRRYRYRHSHACRHAPRMCTRSPVSPQRMFRSPCVEAICGRTLANHASANHASANRASANHASANHVQSLPSNHYHSAHPGPSHSRLSSLLIHAHHLGHVGGRATRLLLMQRGHHVSTPGC